MQPQSHAAHTKPDKQTKTEATTPPAGGAFHLYQPAFARYANPTYTTIHTNVTTQALVIQCAFWSVAEENAVLRALAAPAFDSISYMIG